MSKKKFKPGDIVYVEWEDHCSAHERWEKVEEAYHHICTVKTVGFVVRDSDKYITVALMMQPGNEVMAKTITIIKSCIIKIKKIITRGK